MLPTAPTGFPNLVRMHSPERSAARLGVTSTAMFRTGADSLAPFGRTLPATTAMVGLLSVAHIIDIRAA
jgi:hypothetical protein